MLTSLGEVLSARTISLAEHHGQGVLGGGREAGRGGSQRQGGRGQNSDEGVQHGGEGRCIYAYIIRKKKK